MIVTEGQSYERPTDGRWIKISLTVGEEDLLGLLTEWGSEDSVALRARIRSSLAYDILSVHAQILLATRAYMGGGLKQEELQILLSQLGTRVGKHRVSVGLPKEGS